jgi:hypothetical protein
MSQQIIYDHTSNPINIPPGCNSYKSCAQDCQHSTIIFNKLLLEWLAMLQNTANNRFKLKRSLCIPESDVQRTHAKNTNFQKTIHSIAMDWLSKTNTKLCLYERSWKWYQKHTSYLQALMELRHERLVETGVGKDLGPSINESWIRLHWKSSHHAWKVRTWIQPVGGGS